MRHEGIKAMLKLQLKKRKVTANYKHLPWATCAPFVDNSRALLIHRPRAVSTFNTQKQSHIAVEYWCGNHASGGNKFTFLDTLQGGKLLCERCEKEAVLRGLPSADELVGRHVHKGKLIAVRTCCNTARKDG